MTFTTCDLYDEHGDGAEAMGSPLTDFGGRTSFTGTVVTVRCFEDNSLVKQLAAQPGAGKVMVVDGGSSLRCALMGDLIAQSAADNGWEGAVIFGAVRDRAVLSQINLGIKALGTTPRKSVRLGAGEQGVELTVGGVTIRPADTLYADLDGILLIAGEQQGIAG